jgi:ABC-type phosphate/phosphonate transport system substrate-binding protein
VAAHLSSGRLDFALLTEAQLEEVRRETQDFELVAHAELSRRTGLIVTKADSDIQSLAGIKGRRFSFGPRGDAVLHYAALSTLSDAGVTIDDIKPEIIPGSTLQYHFNSFESAKEIALGTTVVGVIDKAEYEAYPDTGFKLLPLTFAKDQFRVLGETNPLPLGPFVASTHCDPELVATVRQFLVDADEHRPEMVASLGVASFTGAESRP